MTSTQDFDHAASTHTMSKRSRLKSLSHHLTSAAKRMSRRSDATDDYDAQMEDDGPEIEGITDNPAFNPGEVLQNQNDDAKSKKTGLLHKAAHLIAHPTEVVKKEAAQQLAPTEHPYLTEGMDEELLEAEDEFHIAQAEAERYSDIDSEYVEEKERKIDGLEKRRDQMRVAWITGKHVRRVRVVPQRLIGFPDRSKFKEFDARGNYVRFQWERWAGHMLLYLTQEFTVQYIDDSNDVPYDRDTLMRHVERLLVATAPWQAWLVNVRRMYTWEDPWHTGKWLVWYLFLIKIGYIFPFVWSYSVFVVLKNRYWPNRIGGLREAHERANDPNSMAMRFSELVNRHGREGWVEPLLSELGPFIQQQLSDLADYLEILINYYNWRKPQATAYSLIFFATMTVFSAVTRTEFSIKTFYVTMVLYFFFSRPISARYSRYRHAVSVFRWVWWNIPTHAENAFDELRARAQEARECMIEEEVEVNTKLDALRVERPVDGDEGYHSPDGNGPTLSRRILGERDVLSFRGRWQSHTGSLIVTTNGNRFVRSTSLKSNHHRHGEDTALWRRTFLSLVEMRKISGPGHVKLGKILPSPKTGPTEALVFVWTDGQEDMVESMKKRDECFNTVIGFSGLRYMSLQLVPPPETQENCDKVTDGQWVKGEDKHQGTLEE